MVSITTKITREVDAASAFGAPIRRFFDRLMILAHSKAAAPGQVPVDKGYLQDTLAPGGGVTEVGGDWPGPYYAQVGSGLVYGAVLEASTKTHYRAGPSAGAETQGWLSRIVPPVTAEIPALAAKCAADIRAAWDHG